MTDHDPWAGLNRIFRLPLGSRLVKSEVDDELRFHLEERIEELVAAGLSPADAERIARERFGNVRRVRAQLRTMDGKAARRRELGELVYDVLRDVRHVLRSLGKAPGFVVVAALTLALALGATTLIFSVVNGVVLRPLPYDDAGRLVRVFETAPGRSGELRSIAHPTLDAWGDLRAFEGIALYGPWSLDLAGTERAEQLRGAAVSTGFFATLRASPAAGRAFTREEHQPGGPRVIVLTDGLRHRLFGDATALGETLNLGGEPFTVVGVMPPGFAYPAGAEFWVTTGLDAEWDARRARHLSAIGRLRPGVDVAGATADLLRVEASLAEQFPEAYTGYGIQVTPLHEQIVGPVRKPLLLVLGAVSAVLLIACANVANLTLARSAGRRREFAVRAALGAGAGRVARLVVLENLVLAVIGGTAGIFAAGLGLDAMRGFLTERLPRIAEVSLDWRVVGVAAGVTLLAGLLVGLAPVFQAFSPDLQDQLKEGGRSQTSARGHTRLRGALVIAQTAMALVLVTSAGLLVKSFTRLMAVDPGVRTEGVLTFGLGLSGERRGDAAHIVEFYRRVRESLEAIPGVERVGLASRLPLSGADHSNSFRLTEDPPDQQRSAQDRAVTPGYFRALEIPVRGREFTETDRADGAPVVIVNESFARQYFPGRDAVGQRFTPSRAGRVSREIVGVAGDARQSGPDVPVEPEFYLPHAQDPWPWLSVVIRTAGDPLALLRQVEEAVWSIDRNLPLTSVRTMDDLYSASVAPRRLGLALIGLFAVLAVVLAVIGAYGVMAYLVTERLPEVGIRMAVGATSGDVVRLVVGRGLRLAAIGIGIGLVGAAIAGRSLQGMLFEVRGQDPATLVAASAVLGAAVLLASFLPARRASRVDPVRALRG